MRPRLFSAALGLALGFIAAQAQADGPPSDRVRAREAYDRATVAHARGDHAVAARELALADALVPSAVTLEAALESAMLADDAALAITLCDRSTRAPADPKLADLLEQARARFGRRVGRVRVVCTSACSVVIDGSAAASNSVQALGHHVVAIEHDGQREERPVDVEPGATIDVTIAPSPGAPNEAPEKIASAGPTPAWFIAALASTAVAGAVTIGFGVDTANKHVAFVSAGCTGPTHRDCTGFASDGQAAQLRTNVMIGVTSVLGAATVVAGVLTFRAHRGAVAVGLGPTSVTLRTTSPW